MSTVTFYAGDASSSLCSSRGNVCQRLYQEGLKIIDNMSAPLSFASRVTKVANQVIKIVRRMGVEWDTNNVEQVPRRVDSNGVMLNVNESSIPICGYALAIDTLPPQDRWPQKLMRRKRNGSLCPSLFHRCLKLYFCPSFQRLSIV